MTRLVLWPVALLVWILALPRSLWASRMARRRLRSSMPRYVALRSVEL